jgi:hypothetical protein
MTQKAPYICYSGQWSTAFTNDTLLQAPNYTMNVAHAHTLDVNYKQIEPQTDEAYGDQHCFDTRTRVSHSGADENSVLLGYTTLSHCVIGYAGTQCLQLSGSGVVEL